MRIVIDTNVLVSAIFFGGKPAELIRMVLARSVSAVASQEILNEYQETIDYLLKKYGGEHLRFSAIPIYSAMEIIIPSSKIDVCRDPDDNKFISCAIDGDCYYIVSGDKDLLILEQFQSVRIVTVVQFFEILKEINLLGG